MMKDNYYFKKARIEDCPLIHETAAKVWEPTYGDILSSEQLKYMFEWMYSVESLERQIRNGHTFFLLYEIEEVIGYVSIEKEDKERYHLQKIYLIPEKQGKGLGKLLIQKAESFVRECEPGKKIALVLNVNRNNKAFDFYTKQGFQIESEGDFPIGNGYYMNDYIMIKIIE